MALVVEKSIRLGRRRPVSTIDSADCGFASLHWSNDRGTVLVQYMRSTKFVSAITKVR
jgi:hypothetical protein